MSKSYLAINAWREILARLFTELRAEPNISPKWLINPATRRRLKLDVLYPQIGVAVRFTGLTAKGQPRRSDWDVLEEQQRNQTRVELCRLNGIQLFVLDPMDEPARQMDGLLRVLGRASRILAQSSAAKGEKQEGMASLAHAQQRGTRLRTRLSTRPDQTIATLSEAWRDREVGLSASLQPKSQDQAVARALSRETLENLSSGQKVIHSHFGDGVVTEITGAGSDATVKILFDADQEKTFLARLLTDKLRPA